jgi:hypothetical protein
MAAIPRGVRPFTYLLLPESAFPHAAGFIVVPNAAHGDPCGIGIGGAGPEPR